MGAPTDTPALPKTAMQQTRTVCRRSVSLFLSLIVL